MRRRQLLSLCAALGTGCDALGSHDRVGVAPSRATGVTTTGAPEVSAWSELSFAATGETAEEQHALVRRASNDAPLLIALHGAGEAARGLVLGARGWRDDYALGRADGRLHAPPLTEADFEGFVTSDRVAALNAALSARSYRGLSVACPYTPRLRTLEAAAPFARFLFDRLLPRIKTDLGLAPASLGIDGVSMGGRLALLVGLSHPSHFAAVGALQPALAEDEALKFAELAAAATATKKLALRLVSSTLDPFLPAIRALAEELTKRGVAHDLYVSPGPHDYAWNRGPGSLEMLLWHDRVLRGETGHDVARVPPSPR